MPLQLLSSLPELCSFKAIEDGGIEWGTRANTSKSNQNIISVMMRITGSILPSIICHLQAQMPS